jgi:hypothetical protein
MILKRFVCASTKQLGALAPWGTQMILKLTVVPAVASC